MKKSISNIKCAALQRPIAKSTTNIRLNWFGHFTFFHSKTISAEGFSKPLLQIRKLSADIILLGATQIVDSKCEVKKKQSGEPEDSGSVEL